MRFPTLALAAAVTLATPADAVKRRAFVTSVTGNGNLASWPGASGTTAHERADAICRAAAAAASPAPLPNASTYRAWISTSTTDAYCHVQGLTGTKNSGCGGASLPGGGPWYLVNGITQYTAGLDDLVSSPHAIYRPVIFDENLDEVVAERVLTGTSHLGIVVGSNTCLDWTSASAGQQHAAGRTSSSAVEWSSFLGATCNLDGHLLCLEPGASEVSELAWSPGVLAFVTSVQGSGNLSSWPQADGLSGLAAGDRICQSLAAAAGLPSPQSFVAWLSTDGEHAVDRLTSNGPFRRRDAYPLAHTLADLVDGVAANSLHVTESGGYLTSVGFTWTGTGADGLASGGNCDGWTSVQGTGSLGLAVRARNDDWTGSWSSNCSSLARLYCFGATVTLFWDGFETADSELWSATVP